MHAQERSNIIVIEFEKRDIQEDDQQGWPEVGEKESFLLCK